MGEPQYVLLLPHCSAGRKPRGLGALGCRLPFVRGAGAPAATRDCSVLGPLCCIMVGSVLLPLLPGLMKRSSPAGGCLHCTAEGSLRAKLWLLDTTVGVLGKPQEAGSAGDDSEVPSAPGRCMTNGSGPSPHAVLVVVVAVSTLQLSCALHRAVATAGRRCWCSGVRMRTAIWRSRGTVVLLVGWQVRASGAAAGACGNR